MIPISTTSSDSRPSLVELAWTFNHIALASFGGGLSAWSREVVVVEKKWMSDEEFLSALTMCRILPGAKQINMAVFVGSKFRGIAGAFAACFGLTFMPVVIVLAMSIGYFKYNDVPAMQQILKGAAAGAVALTFSMAIKTGRKCLYVWFIVGDLNMVATFVMNGVLHWSLLGVLAIVAPPALLWAWPKGRGA